MTLLNITGHRIGIVVYNKEQICKENNPPRKIIICDWSQIIGLPFVNEEGLHGCDCELVSICYAKCNNIGEELKGMENDVVYDKDNKFGSLRGLSGDEYIVRAINNPHRGALIYVPDEWEYL